MGISKRAKIAMSGLVFAGASVLAVGPATAANAETTAAAPHRMVSDCWWEDGYWKCEGSTVKNAALLVEGDVNIAVGSINIDDINIEEIEIGGD